MLLDHILMLNESIKQQDQQKTIVDKNTIVVTFSFSWYILVVFMVLAKNHTNTQM